MAPGELRDDVIRGGAVSFTHFLPPSLRNGQPMKRYTLPDAESLQMPSFPSVFNFTSCLCQLIPPSLQNSLSALIYTPPPPFSSHIIEEGSIESIQNQCSKIWMCSDDFNLGTMLYLLSFQELVEQAHAYNQCFYIINVSLPPPRGGYVFAGVCLFVFLSVILFVSKTCIYASAKG